MPIYEFECQICGKQFEIFVRLHDPANIQCPACSSGSIHRIMSTFSCLGVQLTKKFRMEAEEGLKRERVR